MPREISRLTWPQFQSLLGAGIPEGDVVAPAVDAGEPTTIGAAQNLFREEQAKIFARMAESRGTDLRGLAASTIDDLSELYTFITGNVCPDRLKMRVCLLSHLPAEQPAVM